MGVSNRVKVARLPKIDCESSYRMSKCVSGG